MNYKLQLERELAALELCIGSKNPHMVSRLLNPASPLNGWNFFKVPYSGFITIYPAQRDVCLRPGQLAHFGLPTELPEDPAELEALYLLSRLRQVRDELMRAALNSWMGQRPLSFSYNGWEQLFRFSFEGELA